MGNAAATISIDRFRRRRAANAAGVDARVGASVAAGDAAAPGSSGQPGQHPLVGAALGVVDRHYGLMSSEQTVSVTEVIAATGDLAVADRLAFVAAMERRVPIVVVEHAGWYLACATDQLLDIATLAELRTPEGAAVPRIMSIVTDRGITPALGPLCA